MLEANTNSFFGVDGTLVPASFAAAPMADLLCQAKNQNELALSELMKRHKNFIDCKVQKFAPDWSSRVQLTEKVNDQIRMLIGEVKTATELRMWLEKLIQRVFFEELRKKEELDKEEGRQLTGHEIVRAKTRNNLCGIEPDYADEDSKLCDELFRKKAMVVSKIAKLDQVPEKLKQAQFLHDIEGLSFDEIAKLTKLDADTLKQSVASARAKIREELAPYFKNAAEP